MRRESYKVLNTSCEMLRALSAWWKIVTGTWLYNNKFEIWNVISRRICVEDNKHKETFLVLKSSWEREKIPLFICWTFKKKKKKKEEEVEGTDEICFIYFTYFGN